MLYRHVLCTFLSCNTLDWIINSGSTDHICPNIDVFDHYESMSDHNNFITIPNGTRIKVLHKCSVRLNKDIILNDVLHVPDFCFRLIPVTKLCQDLSCHIMFIDKDCFIQGLAQNRTSILLDSSINGLYRNSTNFATVSTQIPGAHCNAVVSSTEDLIKVWHLRLGHLPVSQLNLVAPVPSSTSISKKCCMSNMSCNQTN